MSKRACRARFNYRLRSPPIRHSPPSIYYGRYPADCSSPLPSVVEDFIRDYLDHVGPGLDEQLLLGRLEDACLGLDARDLIEDFLGGSGGIKVVALQYLDSRD